jgi:hypothetical protein
MAYHITLIMNRSKSAIALTNPATEADSKLVAPGDSYKPKRPVLVNKIDGNPTYSEAATKALNIYTYTNNYCFWDNTNSAVNGVGEHGGTIAFNASAGDLDITVNADGTLTFAKASAVAAAGS